MLPSGEPYDVIVVGARAAGAATALLLARAGRRVLVVDRGRYGTDTLSTHALMRGAVLQLARWNLLSPIESAGTPPVRATTFHYETAALTIAIKPRDGVNSLLAPRRYLLDRTLVDAAVRAGADVRYGLTARDVILDRDGRVTGIVVLDDDRRPIALQGRLVVGADGLHSKIATLVDAPILKQTDHAAGIVYGYWPDLPVEHYEWYWASGSAVGAIPTNGRETCVFVALPSAEFGATFRGDLLGGYRRVLTRCAPGLSAEVGWSRAVPHLHGFAGHPGYLRQSHGPGWALVGDAGYFKDPLTAHGITDAFRDAELLAEAVLDGHPQAFSHYQRVRDDLSLGMLQVTDRIASFEWTLDNLQELHRQLSEEMAHEVEALQTMHLSGRQQ
jgi:menaquinone-9 beta-reductase